MLGPAFAMDSICTQQRIVHQLLVDLGMQLHRLLPTLWQMTDE